VVKTTNREIWETFDAMAPLVHRPWKDGKVALNLAKTFRRLREKHDEIDEARQALLAEHAARSEDGGYAKEPDGNIRLKDPVEFNKRWRELLLDEAQLEVFPVRAKVVGDGKAQLTAYQYELLINLGILEDGEKPRGEKETEAQH
jgi:hypothetical protein